MTRVFVYRLLVEYPEGVDWQNPPDAWTPDTFYDSDGTPEETTFSWPRERCYLSRGAAEKRANLLRSYGCTVRMLRAEAGPWSDLTALNVESEAL
jgi:hypothetical protein